MSFILMIEMEKTNPAQIHAVTSSLSNEEQIILQKIVQQAKEHLEELDQIPLPEARQNGK